MPEIGECYTIANKIPELGKLIDIKSSKNFNKYINKKHNLVKLIKDNNYFFKKPFAYGKSIWFPIYNDNYEGFIVSQLGMSGSWFLNNHGRNIKNDHLIFSFSKNLLRYSDPRMFGKMKIFLYNKNELNIFEKTLLNYNWGLDPYLSNNKSLILKLQEYWLKSNKDIKSLLLDQNIIFGIGNYLASEILWMSKINPHKKGKELTVDDLKQLVNSTKKIIKLAIKHQGYSFAEGYYHPDGSQGNLQKFIKIYGKEGKSCPNCKSKILKMDIKGRSTYYCKKCQI